MTYYPNSVYLPNRPSFVFISVLHVKHIFILLPQATQNRQIYYTINNFYVDLTNTEAMAARLHGDRNRIILAHGTFLFHFNSAGEYVLNDVLTVK